MRLSEIVKRYREEHNMSKRQFAKVCGISHTQVSRIEEGKNTAGQEFIPSIDTLQAVASGIGTSLDNLLSAMDDVNVYKSDVDEMRDELKDNPDLRMLLRAAADLKPDEIQQLVSLAKMIRK